MAVKFISVKCPDCGASLDIEEGRTQFFCTYCGAKVLVNNENEFVYRHIDEAGIKQAETDRIIKLKQMEIAEKKRASAEKTKVLKIIISLILAVVGIVIMVVGCLLGEDTGPTVLLSFFCGSFLLLGVLCIWTYSEDKEDDDYGDKVKVPSYISEYEKKSYAAIEAILRSAGFTNIRCVPLNDLTTGILKKPDMVDSITINGHEITSGGKKYSPDASVVISYHSFSGR